MARMVKITIKHMTLLTMNYQQWTSMIKQYQILLNLRILKDNKKSINSLKLKFQKNFNSYLRSQTN